MQQMNQLFMGIIQDECSKTCFATNGQINLRHNLIFSASSKIKSRDPNRLHDKMLIQRRKKFPRLRKKLQNIIYESLSYSHIFMFRWRCHEIRTAIFFHPQTLLFTNLTQKEFYGGNFLHTSGRKGKKIQRRNLFSHRDNNF